MFTLSGFLASPAPPPPSWPVPGIHLWPQGGQSQTTALRTPKANGGGSGVPPRLSTGSQVRNLDWDVGRPACAVWLQASSSVSELGRGSCVCHGFLCCRRNTRQLSWLNPVQAFALVSRAQGVQRQCWLLQCAWILPGPGTPRKALGPRAS